MGSRSCVDTSKLPIELKTILELVKEEAVCNRQEEYFFKKLNWEFFLDLSLHHRVYPVLFSKIKGVDSPFIPKPVVSSITNYYRRNTFTMLHLCGEMEAIAKLFTKHEIFPLFLKGPVLATDLYGDISLRTSGDLDILISFEKLEQAEEILLALGYEKDEYFQTVLNDWKWRHHHYTYFHPKKGIKIEIHWRLNPAPGKEPSFEELWYRKRQSSITSFPVYILGKEDLFFFLVTHGARHGWSRLRWLIDIHQLVKKELDWGIVYQLLKRNQCIHVGGQSLILASELLNTELTEKMYPIIKGKRSKELAHQAIFYLERKVNLHTDPVPRDIANYHSRHLFSLMSFSQKCWFWLSVCHPYYTDVETFPLPKNLHFLYFPLRPFLWIWRRSKGHALP